MSAIGILTLCFKLIFRMQADLYFHVEKNMSDRGSLAGNPEKPFVTKILKFLFTLP